MRDERQREFAERFLETTESGILYLCPRFGKCRVAINIFKAFKKPNILIAYPDVNIKKSWVDEMGKTKYKNPNITYTSFASLKKQAGKSYDLIVIDEIHLLSEAQIATVQGFKDRVLGLTGTMSKLTEDTLVKSLKLKVLARYPISQAILEGVVCDYEINIVTCSLDNEDFNDYKGKNRTEKGQFNAYGKVIEKLEKEHRETFFLRLARMRLIQKSIAKVKLTKKLLRRFASERVLVFCGLIETTEKLGCPVFHSKSTEDTLADFSSGKGDHLAVVKLGNTGTTYKALDKVIINYFDSNPENLAQKINRCMSMEYGNPEKKANIWIVCSNEQVEIKWLKKALEFFESTKIKYHES